MSIKLFHESKLLIIVEGHVYKNKIIFVLYQSLLNLEPSRI